MDRLLERAQVLGDDLALLTETREFARNGRRVVMDECIAQRPGNDIVAVDDVIGLNRLREQILDDGANIVIDAPELIDPDERHHPQ